MKSKRIEYIDIARGITIFLVVLGHSYSEENVILQWLYSFHMPFFFIISGLLYGLKYNSSDKLSFGWKEKAKSLLLPYLFWGFVFQMFLWTLEIIGGVPILETFKMRMGTFFELSSGPMWFLPCMFIATLIFFIRTNKKWIHIGVAILLLGIGMFAPEPAHIGFLYRAFIGNFFICFGFYSYKFFRKVINNILFALIGLISLFLIFQNETVSIAARSFGNPILYIVNGCLGTWVLIQLCMKLELSKLSACKVLQILKLWGAKSVVILCTHSCIIEILRLLDYKIFNNVLPKLGIGEGFALSFMVMSIITIFMPILIRLFGWTWGFKKKA